MVCLPMHNFPSARQLCPRPRALIISWAVTASAHSLCHEHWMVHPHVPQFNSSSTSASVRPTVHQLFQRIITTCQLRLPIRQLNRQCVGSSSNDPPIPQFNSSSTSAPVRPTVTSSGSSLVDKCIRSCTSTLLRSLPPLSTPHELPTADLHAHELTAHNLHAAGILTTTLHACPHVVGPPAQPPAQPPLHWFVCQCIISFCSVRQFNSPLGRPFVSSFASAISKFVCPSYNISTSASILQSVNQFYQFIRKIVSPSFSASARQPVRQNH